MSTTERKPRPGDPITIFADVLSHELPPVNLNREPSCCDLVAYKYDRSEGVLLPWVPYAAIAPSWPRNGRELIKGDHVRVPARLLRYAGRDEAVVVIEWQRGNTSCEYIVPCPPSSFEYRPPCIVDHPCAACRYRVERWEWFSPDDSQLHLIECDYHGGICGIEQGRCEYFEPLAVATAETPTQNRDEKDS